MHIDGKTLRHSFDTASSKAAVHMVSVWASKAELAMGQVATDAKSNEITAIPKLLDLISLHGAVVTIDAMGCQRDIAAKIIDGGGDYILAVKDNQKSLHEDVKLLFDEAIPQNFEGMGYDHCERVEKNGGRIETRRAWVTRDVDWLRERGDWKGLRGVVCVESVRELPGKKPPAQRRYFITSLDHRDRGKDAAWFAGLIRDHWQIENKLHWSLDVSFDEDACRVRQGHADENLSRLRRIALNLLKQGKNHQTRHRRQTPASGVGPRLPSPRAHDGRLDAIALTRRWKRRYTGRSYADAARRSSAGWHPRRRGGP